MAGPDMGNGRAAGSQFRDLLDALEGAGEGKGVATVADINESLGVRSFGPLLLAAGLIGLTPIGDIPTVLAVIVVLISGQLLIGLRGFWLPGLSFSAASFYVAARSIW